MWTPTKGKKFGVAIYNWSGEVKYGLSLTIGDAVQVFEECFGWYRGFLMKNRSVKGIFPCSYIYLKPCKVENEGIFETVVPIEDTVVREMTMVLREWNEIWKNLFVERKADQFTTLKKVMKELLEWRKQLLSGTLTLDQTRELKLRITSKIDWGNKNLGLDLVPRCGAEMVDPGSMCVVELFHLHLQNSESCNLLGQQTYFVTTLKKVGLQHKTNNFFSSHIYFCVREFGYLVGEDVEIFFSLYDDAKGYISERFLVKISIKEGFSNYLPKFHSGTIFTDLGNSDINKNLYIIAHVMRVGKMLHSESNRKLTGTLTSSSSLNNATFRRPLGVGVLSIGNSLTVPSSYPNDVEEKDYSFKVYQCEEKEFYSLHDYIIHKQTSKFSPISLPSYAGSSGIDITLKILEGPLDRVVEENPILLKNVSVTRKMGYPNIIMPGDVRNDLYITLERGEFERGGKSVAKNIEVTISVYDGDGNIIENCLFGASGMESASKYHSMVIYHHNSPIWNETIRLEIPLDKYNLTHLRFEYRHCSTRDKSDNKKLFGFSFARLMGPEGATLQDGDHTLFVYKYDDKMTLEPKYYMILPSNKIDLDNGYKFENNTFFTCSNKETVRVSTLLCSTKLTQNADLLCLLQWRSHKDLIHESLNKALRINGEELVKFLQDILDALFSMFSTDNGNSTLYSGSVFRVLAHIFDLLYDPKFEHFQPVIDTYINDHFSAAVIYKGLLQSIRHCAENLVQHVEDQRQEQLKKCFRSLEYIFKFIIASRMMFTKHISVTLEEDFREDLNTVFTVFNKMLSQIDKQIEDIQIMLLNSISPVFDLLLGVLPSAHVARLAVNIIDSLPTREKNPKFVQAKLVLIRNIVSSELFKKSDCRSLLLTNSCRHLRNHLSHFTQQQQLNDNKQPHIDKLQNYIKEQNNRNELHLCMDILAEILSFLFHKSRNPLFSLQSEVEIVCISTLDSLLQTVLLLMDRSDLTSNCLVANLVGLLQLLNEYHYTKFWDSLVGRKPLKDFLLRIFLVFRNLIKENIFPSDWMVMKMTVNNVILSSLEEISKPLVFEFLDTRNNFDCQIWSTYFNLAVEFLTQSPLQLENFSIVKREKILEKYGDMRVLMGYQILSVWSKLGEKNQVNFIPTMVGPFLEVTMIPQEELRKATLHIFFDMMKTEESVKGNFKMIEAELIEKLDHLINLNKGDNEYRQLFNTILLDRIQKENPIWRETGSNFINSVTRLLERLLDYRNVIQGDENRDKRMSCTVNLLNFYKNEIGRKEMYLRYIYKLHDLHFSADNFTEAGFTLKLYADSLNFDSTNVLTMDCRGNNMQEWKRKEQLFQQIIDYFDKGKCWEKAIPLCKELAELYEKQLFDYKKFSEILTRQAKLCDQILIELRPEPEYFRVGFFGLSFPLFVRNKIFIYRGLEYEKVQTFTQRIQTEFPSAQMFAKSSPPSHSVMQSDTQSIQICCVRPLSENGPPTRGVPLANVPNKIGSFYQVNDVSKFQVDRPMHRGVMDRDNEIKTLWLERTTMTTSNVLPGILRWFEVIDSTTEEISPIQFACETMEGKNAELKQLITLHKSDPNRSIKPFTMRLQGNIDANVMGGVTKYQDAFFNSEFIQSNPSFIPYVHRLELLIRDHMDILETGLAIHEALAPADLLPLQQRLMEKLGQMRQSLRTPSMPNLPEATHDQYTNTPVYGHINNTIGEIQLYNELLEPGTDFNYYRSDFQESECNITTNKNFDVNQDCDEDRNNFSKLSSTRGSFHGLNRYSVDSNITCNVFISDEAPPPLPPRTSIQDRRSVISAVEVPPPPPKRTSIRKNSEDRNSADFNISSSKLLMRDSGFSEPPPIPYEEFVLKVVSPASSSTVPLLSPRTACPLDVCLPPPPLPPKTNNDDDRPIHEKEYARIQNIENYSVPKLKKKLDCEADVEGL